jgi:hypothetical protein
MSDRQVAVRWKHLIPHQFPKGVSGNPGGRPRRKPFTEALELTGDLPCPPKKRLQLEEILGVELPKGLTMVQAEAIGQHLKGITDTDTAAWIADRIDGTVAAEIQLGAIPGGAPLLIPSITVQLVEVNNEGETIKTITLEPPPRIGEEPNQPAPKPTNVNGSGDATAELPGSDPR